MNFLIKHQLGKKWNNIAEINVNDDDGNNELIGTAWT